ncbi:MAG TPA: hypothetical protein VJ418_08725, partial [Streptosporangiaceae bacterium]|nr:hypothetical protein [Streptosporangiaceae bacterium]
ASQAPYYWPVMSPHLPALHGWPLIGNLHARLPGLHAAPGLHAVPRLGTLLSSAADWLLRHA